MSQPKNLCLHVGDVTRGAAVFGPAVTRDSAAPQLRKS